MVSAIIVMAGSGTRLGLNQNKVLLPLGTRPMFCYSVALFTKLKYEVILVIRKEDEAFIRPFLSEEIRVVYGGKTRSESVYNGLGVASGDIILVHDAARPLIKEETVLECVKEINKGRAVFVGVKSIDTVRQKTTEGFKTLDRATLVYAQTPQGAKKDILLSAYHKEKEQGFLSTDEISLIEKYTKEHIVMVVGNEENFKITTKKDYTLAKLLVGDLDD